jgi:hypothetical protein
MDVESQELFQRRNNTREFLRWIPVLGIAISFYSAVFATFILYPWHIELSKEFDNVRQTCLKF